MKLEGVTDALGDFSVFDDGESYPVLSAHHHLKIGRGSASFDVKVATAEVLARNTVAIRVSDLITIDHASDLQSDLRGLLVSVSGQDIVEVPNVRELAVGAQDVLRRHVFVIGQASDYVKTFLLFFFKKGQGLILTLMTWTGFEPSCPLVESLYH